MAGQGCAGPSGISVPIDGRAESVPVLHDGSGCLSRRHLLCVEKMVTPTGFEPVFQP